MRVSLSDLREADDEGRPGAVDVHTPEIVGPLVVGRVLEIEELTGFKKPIRYSRVDVGAAEPASIICGARNFAVDDLVVVALPGTRFPDGFTIEARTTYGRVSEGMMCSPRELGLRDDHSTIVVLPADIRAVPGTPVGG
jgi:phenylalanyl-tRNA synthetase beta chain